MPQGVFLTLNDLAVWATLGAFVIPLISLAFSARRWLTIRDTELKAARFQTYHVLVHSISSGTNERGIMKLTSQIAYVYELRNFPEYAHLTETVLTLLRKDWTDKEASQVKTELIKAIDQTLAHVQRAA
ncbi:hypothetical protein ASF11_00910 [Acidovorax sp. Leaf76]|nr:hypothetical protein ASF11_00910 [Acidovorax sp. Leaf76]KQS38327.1 hypothetical protein ASG27_23415 [Acidovorax sp. Leaf191]